MFKIKISLVTLLLACLLNEGLAGALGPAGIEEEFDQKFLDQHDKVIEGIQTLQELFKQTSRTQNQALERNLRIDCVSGCGCLFPTIGGLLGFSLCLSKQCKIDVYSGKVNQKTMDQICQSLKSVSDIVNKDANVSTEFKQKAEEIAVKAEVLRLMSEVSNQRNSLDNSVARNSTVVKRSSDYVHCQLRNKATGEYLFVTNDKYDSTNRYVVAGIGAEAISRGWWSFERFTDSQYYLRNINKNEYMHVLDADLRSGPDSQRRYVLCEKYSYRPDTPQYNWIPEDLGGNYIKLKNVKTNEYLYMDMEFHQEGHYVLTRVKDMYSVFQDALLWQKVGCKEQR